MPPLPGPIVDSLLIRVVNQERFCTKIFSSNVYENMRYFFSESSTHITLNLPFTLVFTVTQHIAGGF